jgi:putative addiction module component (TIGR02574 family)
MATNPLREILKLSGSERIRLVEGIWDSIAADADALTEEQRAELDRRLLSCLSRLSTGYPPQSVLRPSRSRHPQAGDRRSERGLSPAPDSTGAALSCASLPLSRVIRA